MDAYQGLQEEINLEINNQRKIFFVKNQTTEKRFSKRLIKTKFLKDHGYIIKFSNGNFFAKKSKEEKELLKKRKNQHKISLLRQ